jgi:phosphoribosylformylglycinamidine synthase
LGRADKPITLMDIATIGARELKAKGILQNLDESEEINACSIKIKVDVNGVDEDYLLMFKNETHNHPTEIEPFGGAATCLGGAIRDPLSGRSYVYQAMRVTGAANPLVPVSDTMRGKLPQRKITVGAANGYSSYGNQIGLATGQVSEVYHPGYAAKRLEIGAVIGAAPEKNVRRERPDPGDVIILLGGKTGRDGCGGATGSSKAHSLDSLESCGAEVQKGNAPEERKLQRLFRNPEVTAMIKRCNDFGAGGVSVAIGELADGLIIDLSKVPKKYDGLDGTELAI